MSIVVMSAGEENTFLLQLGFQLLVLVSKLLVLQEEFMVQPGTGIGAKLKKKLC